MHRTKTFLVQGSDHLQHTELTKSSTIYFGRCNSSSDFSVRPMIFCTDYLNIHWTRAKHKNDYVACFFRCSSGQDTLIQIPSLSQTKIEPLFHYVPMPYCGEKWLWLPGFLWQMLISCLHISECSVTLSWYNHNSVYLILSCVSQWMTDFLTM